MKITLVASITPVNDVAGPLIMYRHFKYLERDGHILRIITHERAGFQQGENWETIKLKHTVVIKWIRRVLFRKYFRWIGEELISFLFYKKAKKYFKEDLPDVILTSWTDYMLPCAYNLSKLKNIPLVIFCHDDFENQIVSDPINNYLKRLRLGNFYRHAAVRLCVAEGMNEEFFKRYRAWGHVLYPIGGETFPLSKKMKENTKKLIFGYFGSISNGYIPLLFLADCLAKFGHELHISSTGFPESGPYVNHPTIKNLGFFKERHAFLDYIKNNIDVCVVAQSFKPEDKIFLKTNFPSKLIDMMGFNLPIVIISPEYSSSARIAMRNPSSLIHIRSMDSTLIDQTIESLSDFKNRAKYAVKIRQLYENKFAPDRIHKYLLESLNSIEQRI